MLATAMPCMLKHRLCRSFLFFRDAMSSTYLLMLAICAVWLPPLPLPRRLRLALWLPLLVLAVVTGMIDGRIQAMGVIGLLGLGVAAWGAARASVRWQRRCLLILVLLMSLLLALHRWPGFINVQVLPRQTITPDALPFLLYANFDKGAAGLLLLALLAPRCQRLREWSTTLRFTLLPGFITIATVMLLGWLIGMVRPEWKWPPFAGIFLAINLLLTVVAEEAFFRGLIQHRLQAAFKPLPAGDLLAVLVSALLFGAAHLGGGLGYAALATVAGLGYAWVFLRSARIEAAIALHFTLNAVHFIGFTYPALA